MNIANDSSTVVELSPHHPKVKGSSSAACPGTGRKNGESSNAASNGSTEEDPSPRDPKVMGSSSTAPIALGR